MIAITIAQPGASLIVTGHKRFCAHSHGSRLRPGTMVAIHAATGPVLPQIAGNKRLSEYVMSKLGCRIHDLPRGNVLGFVQLAAVGVTEDFAFSENDRLLGSCRPGQRQYQFSNPRPCFLSGVLDGKQWPWRLETRWLEERREQLRAVADVVPEMRIDEELTQEEWQMERSALEGRVL